MQRRGWLLLGFGAGGKGVEDGEEVVAVNLWGMGVGWVIKEWGRRGVES